MKKFLAIFLTLVLCLSLFPVPALAEGTTGIAEGTIENTEISWSIGDSGVLTFSGAGAIPDYGYESGLTTAPWGAYADSILSAVIGDGITAIGNYAFYGLPNIITVTTLGDVTSIGQRAFRYCPALSEVKLTGALKTLGNYAFSNSGLTVLPNLGTVENLPEGCFRYCDKLKAAHLPEGVASVGYQTFSDCTALEEVTLPRTCTYMASAAFGRCSALKSFIVKGVLDSFGSYPIFGTPSELRISFTVKSASSIQLENKIGLNNNRNQITIYGVPGIYNIYANGTPRDTYNSISDHYYLFKSARNLVHFDANGGEGNMPDWDHSFVGYKDDETPSDALPANTFTREGATFAGWSLKKDVSPEELLQFSYGMIVPYMIKDQAQAYCFVPNGEEVTLYAQWIPEEYYNVYVGGVQVNSINKNDVLGDGKVSYDPENKILTLNGYDSGINPGQSKVNDVYRNFICNSTVYTEIDGLTINVTADSVINGNANNWRDGALVFICSDAVINISDGATLTVNGSTEGSQLYSYSAIYTSQSFTVNGPGNFIVNGPVTKSGHASAVYGSMTVDGNATVTLNGGSGSNGEKVGYGMDSDLAVNSGTVTAMGDIAVTWKSVAADGLYIYAGSDEENVTEYTGSHNSEGEAYVKIGARQIQDIVISFDAGGGTGEMAAVTLKGAGEYKLPDCTFTAPDGLEFDCWDAGEIGETVDVSDRVTLTAQWWKGFPDSNRGSWYYNAVKYCAKNGYINGYQNGNFGPNDNLKRQDFVVILANIAKADLSKYQNTTSKLKDVKKGAYYAAAVNWAVDNNIIAGYANGNFGVNDNITREQVATILYRYMGSPEIENIDSTLEKFKDVNRISSFAKTAVAWAVQNNVISGMADGRVAPTEGAARAQIASIIMRMDQQGMFNKA